MNFYKNSLWKSQCRAILSNQHRFRFISLFNIVSISPMIDKVYRIYCSLFYIIFEFGPISSSQSQEQVKALVIIIPRPHCYGCEQNPYLFAKITNQNWVYREHQVQCFIRYTTKWSYNKPRNIWWSPRKFPDYAFFAYN